MHRTSAQVVCVLLFAACGYVFYTYDLGLGATDRTFITITTFVFSMLAGFFITRQSTRYSKIREIISTFDGKLTGCYRAALNLSPAIHDEIGKILGDHYRKVLDSKRWDYHLANKSNTITSIHLLLERMIGGKPLEPLRGQAVGRIMTNLGDCQVLRKNMVMLTHEQMAPFQWYLMVFFVLILIATIASIPSAGSLFLALLKASFVTTIFSVVIILRDLDDLHLFEDFVGENSAKDVLHIIDGHR